MITQILDFPLQLGQIITVFKNTGPGYSATLQGNFKLKLVNRQELETPGVIWFPELYVADDSMIIRADGKVGKVGL